MVDYRWRYQGETGQDVAGPDVRFEDQAEAEEWFGEQWADLLEQGVDQVTLLHGEAEVYGPMSLHPTG
ncbi:MAG TPA: hypothetical protein VGL80_11290 [Pseudonocardiaceae bacterium]|jgi:hypothetical protein